MSSKKRRLKRTNGKDGGQHANQERRALHTRAPHSQLRVARAEQGKKKKRGLYVLLGTEKEKIEQKTNGGCALMCGS